MDPTTIIAIIIAVIITIALYWASSTANRLHRLHVRTDAARQSLQASLDRRAAVLAACEPQFTALAHSTESIPLQYETFAQRAEKERQISVAIAGLTDPTPGSIVDAEARVQVGWNCPAAGIFRTHHLGVGLGIGCRPVADGPHE